MSTLSSLCITCLSNLEEGAKLTETLTTFLCDVLHFKNELLQESPKIICRKCYKTLIDLKCFYTQLRDVEVYFESKSKISCRIDPTDTIEENEQDERQEPYLGEIQCTVSIDDGCKQEPILIDDEEPCVADDDIALKQNKTPDIAYGKRFVCLTCSNLFRSYDDLRSHEKTHSGQPFQKALPVFLAANSPLPQRPLAIICPKCGQEFYNKFSLEAHMKKHKKIKPFYCKSCKHRFPKKELLLYHESKYECVVCHNKCCSRTALELHIMEYHKGNLNGSRSILEIVNNKTDVHQHHNNIARQRQES